MAISKTPLIVTTFGIVLGLTACGGGGDGASYDGSGNSNNSQTVLNLTEFSTEQDNNDQTVGIGRHDYTFGKGSFSIADKTIWGKLNANSGIQYTVADNFFQKTVGDDIANRFKNSYVSQASNDTYIWEFDTIGENSQVLHESVSFKTLDISGKFNFADKQKQNLRLDMPLEYSGLPAEVTFPTGSLCYAGYQTTMSKPTFYFDEDYKSAFTTLEAFMAYYKISSANSSLYFVGTNNQLPLLAYSQNNKTKYAIWFNGYVYEDILHRLDTQTQNTDPSKGMVYCNFVDNKAGDTLEQEIRKSHP